MAKRASKAARVETAEAPSLPASESPRLDTPAIDTPSSGDFASPLADVAPAEVLGSFPPQVPVVMDAVGNTFAEGDFPPESIVPLNHQEPDASVEGAVTGTDQAQSDVSQQPQEGMQSPPVVQGVALDSTHPAIALAQRHHTGAGAPREGAPRYLTPPPFDVFAKRKQ